MDVKQLQDEIDDAKDEAYSTKREVDERAKKDEGFFRKWRNLLRLRRNKS